jgi:hypothetical protein
MVFQEGGTDWNTGLPVFPSRQGQWNEEGVVGMWFVEGRNEGREVTRSALGKRKGIQARVADRSEVGRIAVLFEYLKSKMI